MTMLLATFVAGILIGAGLTWLFASVVIDQMLEAFNNLDTRSR